MITVLLKYIVITSVLLWLDYENLKDTKIEDINECLPSTSKESVPKSENCCKLKVYENEGEHSKSMKISEDETDAGSNRVVSTTHFSIKSTDLPECIDLDDETSNHVAEKVISTSVEERHEKSMKFDSVDTVDSITVKNVDTNSDVPVDDTSVLVQEIVNEDSNITVEYDLPSNEDSDNASSVNHSKKNYVNNLSLSERKEEKESDKCDEIVLSEENVSTFNSNTRNTSNTTQKEEEVRNFSSFSEELKTPVLKHISIENALILNQISQISNKYMAKRNLSHKEGNNSECEVINLEDVEDTLNENNCRKSPTPEKKKYPIYLVNHVQVHYNFTDHSTFNSVNRKTTNTSPKRKNRRKLCGNKENIQLLCKDNKTKQYGLNFKHLTNNTLIKADRLPLHDSNIRVTLLNNKNSPCNYISPYKKLFESSTSPLKTNVKTLHNECTMSCNDKSNNTESKEGNEKGQSENSNENNQDQSNNENCREMDSSSTGGGNGNGHGGDEDGNNRDQRDDTKSSSEENEDDKDEDDDNSEVNDNEDLSDKLIKEEPEEKNINSDDDDDEEERKTPQLRNNHVSEESSESQEPLNAVDDQTIQNILQCEDSNQDSDSMNDNIVNHTEFDCDTDEYEPDEDVLATTVGKQTKDNSGRRNDEPEHGDADEREKDEDLNEKFVKSCDDDKTCKKKTDNECEVEKKILVQKCKEEEPSDGEEKNEELDENFIKSSDDKTSKDKSDNESEVEKKFTLQKCKTELVSDNTTSVNQESSSVEDKEQSENQSQKETCENINDKERKCNAGEEQNTGTLKLKIKEEQEDVTKSINENETEADATISEESNVKMMPVKVEPNESIESKENESEGLDVETKQAPDELKTGEIVFNENIKLEINESVDLKMEKVEVNADDEAVTEEHLDTSEVNADNEEVTENDVEINDTNQTSEIAEDIEKVDDLIVDSTVDVDVDSDSESVKEEAFVKTNGKRKADEAESSESDIEVIEEHKKKAKFETERTKEVTTEETIQKFLQKSSKSLSITLPKRANYRKAPSPACLKALDILKRLKNISTTRVPASEARKCLRDKFETTDDVVVINETPSQRRDQVNRNRIRITNPASNIRNQPRMPVISNITGGGHIRNRTSMPIISNVRSIQNTTPRIVTVQGNVQRFNSPLRNPYVNNRISNLPNVTIHRNNLGVNSRNFNQARFSPSTSNGRQNVRDNVANRHLQVRKSKTVECVVLD